MHYPDLIIGPIIRPYQTDDVYWCEVVRRVSDHYVKGHWRFPAAKNMAEASILRQNLANKEKIDRKSVKYVSSTKGLKRWESTKVERRKSTCFPPRAMA